jgi:Glyoxalase-like domain
VSDLAAAARAFEARYGLASVEGGRHPGWGTANRIVPLGDSYFELVAIVDESEARESLLGRWVAARRNGLARPLGWAVRTQGLDRVAGRLELAVHGGSRDLPGGGAVQWRLAGLEQAVAEPSLPFFIEWAPGSPFPGRTAAAHRDGDVRIAALELEGDADRLAVWLGHHDLPISVRPGEPAVVGIELTGPSGARRITAVTDPKAGV